MSLPVSMCEESYVPEIQAEHKLRCMHDVPRRMKIGKQRKSCTRGLRVRNGDRRGDGQTCDACCHTKESHGTRGHKSHASAISFTLHSHIR